MILSAALFGLVPFLTKTSYFYGGNAINTLFYRNFFSMVFSFFFVKKNHRGAKVSSVKLFYIFIISLLVGGTTLLLNIAYEVLATGIVTSIHFFYPVVIALTSRVFFKDNLTSTKYFSIIMAVVGLLLLMGANKNFDIYGMLLAFLSAVTYGFYIILMEKKGISEVNVFTTSFLLSFFIMLQTMIFNAGTLSVFFIVNSKFLISTIALSICSSFLGVIFLQKGIFLIGSTKASMMSLVEPIVALFCGIVLLKEDIEISSLFGCTILIFSLHLFFKDKGEAKDNLRKEVDLT